MHRVFPSSCSIIASSRLLYVHKTNSGDSRAVVTPFMQDGNYPPRNFATLGPLELRPPFTDAYIFTLQHWAGVRFSLFYKNVTESCVFKKQSLPPLLLHIICYFFPEVTSTICRVPSLLLLFLPLFNYTTTCVSVRYNK